jgi:hypothetical protein
VAIMTNTEKFPLDQAWKSWVDCLKGEDINSIFQQITLMIWDTAIFRLIIEGRKVQFKKNPEDPAINGALHSFIDRNYFYSQSAFIRRLSDKSYTLTGGKAVYSIQALIYNIQCYRNELTRESFLRLKNMPYEYSEIQNRRKEFFRTQPGGKAFFVPPEYDWESVEEAHQAFDRLAGKIPKEREHKDLISEYFFVRLQEKLAICLEITKYVDKFIAHSATPESRKIQNVGKTEITFKKIWDAQKTIFEVAEFLSSIFFSEDHMALAFENPNFYQYWDSPMFEEIEVDKIRNAFEMYRKETEKWNQEGIENTWKWIET